jgi:hypothetical protein
MNQRPSGSGGRYFEILLFTLSSLLLYHTGVGIVLFLVPLQVVASRRGLKGLAVADGMFLVVFLAIRFWPLVMSGGRTPIDILGWLEIALVVLFLLGVVIVNIPLGRRPRTLILILAATGVAGAAALPAALLLPGNAAFQASMSQMFAEVSRVLSGVFAPAADGVGASFFASLLAPETLRKMTQEYFLRSMLVDYIALLTFSWWAGQAGASRTPVLFGAEPRFRFSGFRLESWWLWPFMAAAALVLLDLFFGLSFWAYAAWNVGLVLLFLYGLQGMAIVWFLFEKHHIPRFLWILLIVGILVLAASPGAGLYIVLVVPLFGISENWIRYRVPRNTAPTEQS